MTATRSITAALLLLVAALVAAGCGSGKPDCGSRAESSCSPTTSSNETRAPAGKVAAVPAELKVVLSNIGSKSGAGVPIPARANCTKSIPATCKASITCPVADGAPEGDLALCTWIAETPTEVLTQPDVSTRGVCTQQYGGPEQATVTGTRDGEPIKVMFSRQDGCEIARWDKASPLWTGEVPASTDGAPQAIDGNAPATGSPDASVSSPPTATEPEIITDPIK
jgi:hypothetical protein